MTIEETKKFYLLDEKKYDIKNNKELLLWLEEAIGNGYNSFININDMQKLVDYIASWYEIKYPEREIRIRDGIIHDGVEDMIKPMIKLSRIMNIKQLMYRLPTVQLRLMLCNYRTDIVKTIEIHDKNGDITGYKYRISMQIVKKNFDNDSYLELPDILLCADAFSGEVCKLNDELDNYIGNKNIKIDELLTLFKEKYSNDLDFTALEECIYNHNCDTELRNKILQLAALKLLYSRNTTPERGYERAKRLINEFNKKLKLHLTTDEIDELISGEYDIEKTYADKTFVDVTNEDNKGKSYCKKM